MSKKPKVRYGLRNVHYALFDIDEDGTVTFDKPKKYLGAVNLAIAAVGESNPFYADDYEYVSGDVNDGYDGDYESALVHDSFLEDVHRYIRDDKGFLYEPANVKTRHVALLAEMDTDTVAKRICLYDVLFGRPNEGGKTKEKTTTPQTQTMSVKSRPMLFGGEPFVKISTTPETDKDAYDKFFDEVVKPSAEVIEKVRASREE